MAEPAADTTGTAPAATPARAAQWWRGRYGRALLLEVAICGALLVIYRSIRMFTKGDLASAFHNAGEVVRLEKFLGMPFEAELNNWIAGHTWAARGLNWYYILFHFPGAILLLLWLYLWHGDRYKGFRNLMAFVTFSALVIHLIFPLAPPRMMSGFVDTMQLLGPNIYPQNALKGAANQIAAMPSLHFGWAVIEAIAVIAVARTAWRWLILIHPALMALAIIGTANHWWIDAAAALVIVLGSVAVWRIVLVWAGDRRWSWTKWRFETNSAIAQLEALANAPAPRACDRD